VGAKIPESGSLEQTPVMEVRPSASLSPASSSVVVSTPSLESLSTDSRSPGNSAGFIPDITASPVKIHMNEAQVAAEKKSEAAETSELPTFMLPDLLEAKTLSSPRPKIDMAVEGPRVWKRFLRSCLDDLVIANQKTMGWCRNQHCGYAVVNESETPSQCPACLSNFCGNCGSNITNTC